ncbi:M48 family metalloprotease [bacterium SCSIO 12741]|nr:M48 family metalloprotease [bacterium SCSIO 12741]
MNTLYPPGPKSVPDDLTRPSSKYRKHVWIAVGGILTFVILYVGLTWWFINKALEFIQALVEGSGDGLITFLFAFVNTFLAVFMVKALFFRIQTDNSGQVEVTREQEPKLFRFIDQLVKDSGAPKPHKVYITDNVNAAVFYNLSIFNLLFPSRKNLLIGLGLVNVLNLGEFKAVLAHEFGHFGQRSMLVGRWVYVAHQIAAYIVAKRDFLDKVLGFISGFDLRIAWIGWILSIIVWSIRSVVEIAFRLVVMAERKLSQEMEFHADSVAVSLTGSDALVHALQRLGVGDRGYNSAIDDVNKLVGEKHRIPDIYDFQSNAIQKLSGIYNQSEWLRSPQVPEKDPEKFRVFKSRLAQPPKMWATHPPDFDRENEAKKRYIPATIDDRSAWELFQKPEKWRKDITENLYRNVEGELSLLSSEDALSRQNQEYEKLFLQPRYRGLYRSISLFQSFKKPEDIYSRQVSIANLQESLQGLYPENLGQWIEDREGLFEETNMLEGVKSKALSTTGPELMHRGKIVKRKDLDEVIAGVKKEIDDLENKINEHNINCQSTYMMAAEKVGEGWPAYLQGLMRLIHYAEHSSREITDSMNKLGNVVAIVTADNRVSSSEMVQLLQACNDVQLNLDSVFTKKDKIKPDELILQKLKLKEWGDRLEEFGLVGPVEQNVGSWLEVVDGWAAVALGALNDLRFSALETLLESQDKIAQALEGKQTMMHAPVPSQVALEYRTLMPGEEREIQTKLGWWDKIHTADGTAATLLRLAAASVIIGGTVSLGAMFDEKELVIYNGFSKTVDVKVDDSYYAVLPHSSVRTEISPGDEPTIEAYIAGQLIEEFEPELERGRETYVYNVARSAVIYNYQVWYGHQYKDGGLEPDPGTSTRFTSSNLDYVLKEPPSSIQSKSGISIKNVLDAFSSTNPYEMVDIMSDAHEIKALVTTHGVWEPYDSPQLTSWLQLAAQFANLDSIVAMRQIRYPGELASYRILMDNNTDAGKDSLCTYFHQMKLEDPENANWSYLACRCEKDNPDQNQMFIDGHLQFPEHDWFMLAASYSYTNQNEWEKAYALMSDLCVKHPHLADYISSTAERVYRVIKLRNADVLTQRHDCQSSHVDNIKSQEQRMTELSLSDDPPVLWYLINGQIDAGISSLDKDHGSYYVFYHLLGASDGATVRQNKDVINLRLEDGLNLNTVWSTWGLRLKYDKDCSEIESYIKKEYDERSERIIKGVRWIKAGNFSEAEKEIKELEPYTRFAAYSVARVLYGQQIPKEWQDCIEGGLFVGEKPFFVSRTSS